MYRNFAPLKLDGQSKNKLRMVRRSIGLIIGFIIVLMGNLYAQKQVAKKTSNGIGYYEYLPKGYSASNENYPTIIFLHGIGERGNGTTQLSRVLRHGLLAAYQQWR